MNNENTASQPKAASIGDDAHGEVRKVHQLKTDPEVFDAVARGFKTHEIRLNDRDFQVGDRLVLAETESTGAAMRSAPRLYPLAYTGRTESRIVSHIQTGYGLADGWCILSFRAPADQAASVLLCKSCEGSGEVMTMVGTGPDGWAEVRDCPDCHGTGNVAAAPQQSLAPAASKVAIDQYGTTRCASCNANLDINEEHGDDCSVVAAEGQVSAAALGELSAPDAIHMLRLALVNAECAIKGREHTGFITKVLEATSRDWRASEGQAQTSAASFKCQYSGSEGHEPCTECVAQGRCDAAQSADKPAKEQQ